MCIRDSTKLKLRTLYVDPFSAKTRILMIESKDDSHSGLPTIAISTARDTGHDNDSFNPLDDDPEGCVGPAPADTELAGRRASSDTSTGDGKFRHQKGRWSRKPNADAWIDSRPSLISATGRKSQKGVLTLEAVDYDCDYDSEA